MLFAVNRLYASGISQWSERERHPVPSTTTYQLNHTEPVTYIHSPVTYIPEPSSNYHHDRASSPSPKQRHSPPRRSPIPDYRTSSPMPAYREPITPIRISPIREITPTPPQRKRVSDRRHQVDERTSRYANSRVINGGGPMAEPPPDYSPPSHPPPAPVVNDKKAMQKTRFAPDPPKAKSGNIIGEYCPPTLIYIWHLLTLVGKSSPIT